MSGNVLSPSIPERLIELETTHSTIFQQAYSEEQSMLAPLYMNVPSSSRSNVYSWMRQAPGMREWIGDRQFSNVEGDVYELINKDYEQSWYIEKNQLLDNDSTLNTFGPMIAMYGAAAGKLEETLTADALLDNALAAFDGKQLFATDHPTYFNGGTYSNLFATKPLTAANFRTATALFRQTVGENGRPLGAKPTTIIVSPELEWTAKDLFVRDLTSDGSSTNGGVTNVVKGAVDVIVADYLGTSLDWYLADLSKPIKPLIWQDRENTGLVSYTAPNDPSVFYKKRFEYGVSRRGALGCSLPFLIAKYLNT